MGQWGSLGYAIGADNGDGNYTYSRSSVTTTAARR